MRPSSAPTTTSLETSDRPEVLAWILINDPVATKELLNGNSVGGFIAAGAPIEDLRLHPSIVPHVRYLAELVELVIPRVKADAKDVFAHNEAQLHQIFARKLQQYLEGDMMLPRNPDAFRFAMRDALIYMPFPHGY